MMSSLKCHLTIKCFIQSILKIDKKIRKGKEIWRCWIINKAGIGYFV